MGRGPSGPRGPWRIFAPEPSSQDEQAGAPLRRTSGGEPRMRIFHTFGAAAAASFVIARACAADPSVPVTTQVTAGHARFEFLTPSLVRMEYSPTGHFVDAPTAAIERRAWPHVAVKSNKVDGWLVVS